MPLLSEEPAEAVLRSQLVVHIKRRPVASLVGVSIPGLYPQSRSPMEQASSPQMNLLTL